MAKRKRSKVTERARIAGHMRDKSIAAAVARLAELLRR